jgi:tRNA pseudouridine13 synthase
LRTLLYSAAQAEAFNRVLAQRISTLDQLLDGDVAWKHANGACFSVADAATGQARCAAFEISPTGPIPGARMTAPAGVPGELEERTCAELGLQHIARRTPDGIRLDGARRPLRVPLGECRVACGEDERGAFLQLGFSLPAGAYATSVVREITKAV